MLVTMGLLLQELLQGFAGPRACKDIIDPFRALPLLTPDRQDHIDAADLRNRCRRAGVQVGTIDALLAQLCASDTKRRCSRPTKTLFKLPSTARLKFGKGMGSTSQYAADI
jgi:hypothetical protein